VKDTSDANGLPVSVDILANSHGAYGPTGLASTGIVVAQDSVSSPEPVTGLGLCELGAMGIREWPAGNRRWRTPKMTKSLRNLIRACFGYFSFLKQALDDS
jgi:hypothetical protein